MQCPECGSQQSDTIDVRNYPNYRRRRRRCNDCSTRYSTYEVSSNIFAQMQVLAVEVSRLVASASTPLIELKDLIAARGEYKKGEKNG